MATKLKVVKQLCDSEAGPAPPPPGAAGTALRKGSGTAKLKGDVVSTLSTFAAIWAGRPR